MITGFMRNGFEEKLRPALCGANRASNLCFRRLINALFELDWIFWVAGRRIRAVAALYTLKLMSLTHGSNIIASSIRVCGADGGVLIDNTGISLTSKAQIRVGLSLLNCDTDGSVSLTSPLGGAEQFGRGFPLALQDQRGKWILSPATANAPEDLLGANGRGNN